MLTGCRGEDGMLDVFCRWGTMLARHLQQLFRLGRFTFK